MGFTALHAVLASLTNTILYKLCMIDLISISSFLEKHINLYYHVFGPTKTPEYLYTIFMASKETTSTEKYVPLYANTIYIYEYFGVKIGFSFQQMRYIVILVGACFTDIHL